MLFRSACLFLCTLGQLGITGSAIAADIPQVTIQVNDKQCDPMTLTVPTGKTQFIIRNNSMRALEWEILKGVLVVEERENIAPGFVQKMTVDLQPGDYDTTCGLLTNPRGKLTVTGTSHPETATPTTANDLIAPLAEYKFYVMMEVAEYVKATTALTDAVKAGDIDRAKTLYAPAHQHYERIEPIAELFADLDSAMDAREDDFEKKANDPAFTGYHRLEKALWVDHSADGMTAIADKLAHDAAELKSRISALPFPPDKVVGGAAALIEEVAATKISGEEERYSRTDLWDFQANIDGAQKIVDLLHPLIAKANPDLMQSIDTHMNAVQTTLAHYKRADGFAPYDQLTEADRKTLQASVTTLAEALAKLRGTLNLTTTHNAN